MTALQVLASLSDCRLLYHKKKEEE